MTPLYCTLEIDCKVKTEGLSPINMNMICVYKSDKDKLCKNILSLKGVLFYDPIQIIKFLIQEISFHNPLFFINSFWFLDLFQYRIIHSIFDKVVFSNQTFETYVF